MKFKTYVETAGVTEVTAGAGAATATGAFRTELSATGPALGEADGCSWWDMHEWIAHRGRSPASLSAERVALHSARNAPLVAVAAPAPANYSTIPGIQQYLCLERASSQHAAHNRTQPMYSHDWLF